MLPLCKLLVFTIWIALALVFSCRVEKESGPPNIIIILADDMGFSDPGCTGSEIKTPSLDNLASNGVLFTNFYSTSRCSPSRASLLTGQYSHRTGIDHLVEDWGLPGYSGHLNKECVTIAEVLQNHGYYTIQTGKWHIGNPREHWPDKRGFEKFYGVPHGGGLYFYPAMFADRPVFKNGEQVFPDSCWYSTDAFTDEAIGFIGESVREDRPFFLYLAYIAPHFPLQVWPEDIRKYKGFYDGGFEIIRQNRLKKQKKLGIIDSNVVLSPRTTPPIQETTDPSRQKRKMEICAAQVDRMDQNIGKLLDALNDLDILENTVIIFLSDNGGCHQFINRTPDAASGTRHSYESYGHWANVSNTPYRLYKQQVHEGGIITPLIVHWPAGIKNPGLITRESCHIIDLMPTCLELAGTQYPSHYKGTKMAVLQGKSLLPLMEGYEAAPDRKMFWEHRGNQAVRMGDWKLVRLHGKPWELYHLSKDPIESNDLSFNMPLLVDTLSAVYSAWMKENNVLDWPVEKQKP